MKLPPSRFHGHGFVPDGDWGKPRLSVEAEHHATSAHKQHRLWHVDAEEIAPRDSRADEAVVVRKALLKAGLNTDTKAVKALLGKRSSVAHIRELAFLVAFHTKYRGNADLSRLPQTPLEWSQTLEVLRRPVAELLFHGSIREQLDVLVEIPGLFQTDFGFCVGRRLGQLLDGGSEEWKSNDVQIFRLPRRLRTTFELLRETADQQAFFDLLRKVVSDGGPPHEVAASMFLQALCQATGPATFDARTIPIRTVLTRLDLMIDDSEQPTLLTLLACVERLYHPGAGGDDHFSE